MTERLTDAQVAALVASDGELDVTNEYFVEIAHPSLRDDLNADAALFALALEVQQSRQRRCDGCAHWLALVEDLTEGECPRMGCQTSRGWHCADFTAANLAERLC